VDQQADARVFFQKYRLQGPKSSKAAENNPLDFSAAGSVLVKKHLELSEETWT